LPEDPPEIPDASAGPPEFEWPSNYFNYFTEIEEYFQQARGTSLFLLSPLDWALIETWKNAGVPLEAVLRGIDAAFEKWRSRKSRTQQVNSLAYCAQAVTQEAQRLLDQQSGVSLEATRKNDAAAAPFTRDALLRYLEANAAALQNAADPAIQQLGVSLQAIAREAGAAPENLKGVDTEDLERRLTTLEEKLLAQLRVQLTEDRLLTIRRELDAQLRPYRSKMNATQLRQLEDQYFERKLLELAGLPRLSLFYMTDYGL
jgi:hypothetical protein